MVMTMVMVMVMVTVMVMVMVMVKSVPAAKETTGVQFKASQKHIIPAAKHARNKANKAKTSQASGTA